MGSDDQPSPEGRGLIKNCFAYLKEIHEVRYLKMRIECVAGLGDCSFYGYGIIGPANITYFQVSKESDYGFLMDYKSINETFLQKSEGKKETSGLRLLKN